MLYLSCVIVVEAVIKRCSVKKVFLEISQNSQENICVRVSFLIKLFFIKKEALAQAFSCEFCEISKNIFFHRTPQVADSVVPQQAQGYLSCHNEIPMDTGVALPFLNTISQP